MTMATRDQCRVVEDPELEPVKLTRPYSHHLKSMARSKWLLAATYLTTYHSFTACISWGDFEIYPMDMGTPSATTSAMKPFVYKYNVNATQSGV